MTALPFLLALAVSVTDGPPAPAEQPGAAGQPVPAANGNGNGKGDGNGAGKPEAGAAAPPSAALPFLPGETMALDVSLSFFKAGEARLTVGPREGEVQPVSLETRTTGLVGLIKLRSSMVSNLDTATGLPRSSRLEGVEPNYRHVDTATFDREANVATVREVGRFDNTYKIDVPPGALDFVALVFRLRTLPLRDGDTGEYQVLAGRTVSRVATLVMGREVVETPAGDFPAIKVRVPTGLSGKVAEKSPTYIWFSDDARRAVVRISADFSVGRGNALLTAYTPGKAP